MFDVVIKNAQVVNAWESVISDVGIKAGRISLVNTQITKRANLEIDAKGAYLMPGLIDTHVHLREPGFSYKETWRTGTAAAICNGITTVLDMPNTKPPTINFDALNIKRKKALNNAFCDYGFFVAANENLSETILLLNESDVVGLKLFLGSTTESLLTKEQNLPQIAKAIATAQIGKPVAIHSELEEVLNQRLASQFAKTHESKRIPAAAAEGLRLAIEVIAKQNALPLHNCHTSTLQEIKLIRQAKQAKLNVSAEATPHHIFLSAENTAKQLGSFAKMNPPLRTATTRQRLQSALFNGIIDVLATDHAPHTKEEKLTDNPPSGIPGLDTSLRLMLLFVRSGRISMPQLVKIMSYNAAKRFRLEGKGIIAEGMHADVVLLEPPSKLFKLNPLRAPELQSKCKWTPFEGWLLPPPPRLVLLRGIPVAERGRLLTHPAGIAVRVKKS